MPRSQTLKPKYCLDKSSGLAFVRLSGKKKYLGTHGSQESLDKYDRLIGEWIARGRAPLPQIDDRQAGELLTVSTLINAWQKWARPRYGQPEIPDGTRPAGELGNYWDVLRELRRSYGPTAAAEFDPFKLETFRESLARDRQYKDTRTAEPIIRKGWSRKVIGRAISRLKSVFKWGASRKLIDVDVYQALCTLEAMPRGIARETEPIAPVPDADVKAILPYLSRHVSAMVQIQRSSGMRPGEVCAMRRCDLDKSAPVWVYRPPKHKTAHHGLKRQIYFGPKAQKILNQFPPRTLDPAEYIFCPAEAEQERNEQRREERKTPLPEKHTKPRRDVGAHGVCPPAKGAGPYDVHAYRRAIERACDEAFPPPGDLARGKMPARGRKTQALRWESDAEWRSRLGEKWTVAQGWIKSHRWHPNQLRHAAATEVRRQHGLDAAQVMLGHSSRRMTEVYAEPDDARAVQLAMEYG